MLSFLLVPSYCSSHFLLQSWNLSPDKETRSFVWSIEPMFLSGKLSHRGIRQLEVGAAVDSRHERWNYVTHSRSHWVLIMFSIGGGTSACGVNPCSRWNDEPCCLTLNELLARGQAELPTRRVVPCLENCGSLTSHVLSKKTTGLTTVAVPLRVPYRSRVHVGLGCSPICRTCSS